MNKRIIVSVLILASSLSMAASDIYAPSLAHLPDYFGTTAATIKLTMSLNVLAYALATLIHGPLSDRFGRRPVLLWGLAGFTLFSLACALAQSVEQLIIARVFQGICAAVEGVLVLAIIRDIFEEQDQVRVIALYGIATALTPAVAPIIGGYIHVWFGWRVNFHVLFAAGFLITIATWYFLQESAEKKPESVSLKSVVQEYISLLRNMDYIRYCVISGAVLGVFFAFITAGPFILINNHKLATENFGYFQSILVVGFMVGSLLASKLIKHISIFTLLSTGLSLLVVSGLYTLIITFNSNESILTLGIAMFLLTLGSGPIFSTTPTLAMQSSDANTGTAAAMLVTFEMGFGAIAAFSVGIFHDGSSRPFGLTIAALALSALIAYVIGFSGRRAHST